ncbi:hypothetical protein DHB74_08985 [Pseudomonas sp. G11-1]|nr:hypothetical protein [Pseudomonas sp. G11-1]MCO5789706.1 hypothetical protein [Pseudomonas sp. G11-2]
MQCPSIDNLELSQRSKNAVESIRSVERFSLALQRVAVGGVVMNIFAGNNSLQSSYAIASTDFVAMTKALAAIPSIARRRISNIAQETAFYVTDHNEMVFWNAVVAGCKQ